MHIQFLAAHDLNWILSLKLSIYLHLLFILNYAFLLNIYFQIYLGLRWCSISRLLSIFRFSYCLRFEINVCYYFFLDRNLISVEGIFFIFKLIELIILFTVIYKLLLPPISLTFTKEFMFLFPPSKKW
jgi:hypothetical protein